MLLKRLTGRLMYKRLSSKGWMTRRKKNNLSFPLSPSPTPKTYCCFQLHTRDSETLWEPEQFWELLKNCLDNKTDLYPVSFPCFGFWLCWSPRCFFICGSLHPSRVVASLKGWKNICSCWGVRWCRYLMIWLTSESAFKQRRLLLLQNATLIRRTEGCSLPNSCISKTPDQHLMKWALQAGPLFSRKNWMWVEHKEKDEEIMTMEMLGVQHVDCSGLSFFTWQLWLEAIDKHKSKHSHTRNKNTHACRHVCFSCAEYSGNKVWRQQRTDGQDISYLSVISLVCFPSFLAWPETENEQRGRRSHHKFALWGTKINQKKPIHCYRDGLHGIPNIASKPQM